MNTRTVPLSHGVILQISTAPLPPPTRFLIRSGPWISKIKMATTSVFAEETKVWGNAHLDRLELASLITEATDVMVRQIQISGAISCIMRWEHVRVALLVGKIICGRDKGREKWNPPTKYSLYVYCRKIVLNNFLFNWGYFHDLLYTATSQWCRMSLVVSQISDNSTVCSTACSGQQQSKIKGLYSLC